MRILLVLDGNASSVLQSLSSDGVSGASGRLVRSNHQVGIGTRGANRIGARSLNGSSSQRRGRRDTGVGHTLAEQKRKEERRNKKLQRIRAVSNLQRTLGENEHISVSGTRRRVPVREDLGKRG